MSGGPGRPRELPPQASQCHDQRGSIAVVERFIRTLKECTRALTEVPLRRRSFQLAVHCTIADLPAPEEAASP